MERDMAVELDQLKREFFDAEHVHTTEKTGLINIIKTMRAVLDMHPNFSDESRAIKGLFNADQTFTSDQIEAVHQSLRKKIFLEETRSNRVSDDGQPLDETNNRLFTIYRMVRNIMAPFLDGFYPLNSELKKSAEGIHIKYSADMSEQDLQAPVDAFITFAKGLKAQISKDFKYINTTLITLLEQVKDLERTLSRELGENDRLKEMDLFEKRINREFGFILESFDVSATINDIKTAVMNKLRNIKELLSRNREKEQQRVQKTRENIETLQKRIEESEKDARKMTKKAELFRKAALKDGLTGLYNRSSFDAQLAESLKSVDYGGDQIFMVLFDVDNFKWINDTFGHVAGDKVLKAVARGLAQRFREEDFIARYGGDEFVVFTRGMNEALVRKRVAAFLSGFSKKRFLWKTEGKSINISLSAGIASAEDGDRPEDLIHRADMAMYTAKKNRPPVPAR